MNTSQLRKIGVPEACLNVAIQGIQAAAKEGAFKGAEAKRLIRAIIDAPEAHTADAYFGPFAQALIAERDFRRSSRSSTARGERTSTGGPTRRCGSRARCRSLGRARSCRMRTWVTACRSAACWRARTR